MLSFPLKLANCSCGDVPPITKLPGNVGAALQQNFVSYPEIRYVKPFNQFSIEKTNFQLIFDTNVEYLIMKKVLFS